MQIKVISVTPTDVQKIEASNDESLPQQVIDGNNEGEMDQIAIKQVLEVGRDDTDYDGDIDTLIQWAKQQTDNGDYTDLKWAIRDLRMRIGTPTWGDPIKNLARFAYLDLEEKRIKKEKRDFI